VRTFLLLPLFAFTVNTSYAADTVTVDPAGVLVVTGAAPAIPAATEVRIGGGQVVSGGPVMVKSTASNALQVSGGASVQGTATAGNVVVTRSTQAAATEAVRGDDPRMTNARPANGGNANTIGGKLPADFIPATDKGAPNGVATLGADGRLPMTSMPAGFVNSSGIKEACRFVSIYNITLSGLQDIDYLTVSEGDRILVVGQTAPSENGIYIASSGAWARASDLDASSEFQPGFIVSIIDGKGIAGSLWQWFAKTAPVLGTDPISFRFISTPKGHGRAVIAPGIEKTLPVAATLFPANVSTVYGESWVFGIVGGTTTVAGPPWVTYSTNGQFQIGALGAGVYRLSLTYGTFLPVASGGTSLMQIGFYKNGVFLEGRTDGPAAIAAAAANGLFWQGLLLSGDIVDVRVHIKTTTDYGWNPKATDWRFEINHVGDYP
jgi:hypothetical protein